MLNWLYRKMKGESEDGDVGFIIPCVLSGVLGLIGTFCAVLHGIPLTIPYIVGMVITYILTSQIDYGINLRYDQKAGEMRHMMVVLTPIWLGIYSAVIIKGILLTIVWLFESAFSFHEKLAAFKLPKFSLPKRKVKTIAPEPVQESGPFRTASKNCESCGQSL